jgi:tol-pal system protein YbgF
VSAGPRRGRRAALLVLVPACAGCLATRDDLRVLQADIAVVRAEQAKVDSARARQVGDVLAAVRASQDSLRALGTRVARWQGDQKEDLYAIQQQLITIQELTGLSQRRLLELRANLEERAQEPGAPAVPSPRGGGVAPPAGGGAAAPTVGAIPSVAPPGAPGPNQLLQLALDQLRRGSAGSARAGFQDLVTQYPSSDVAPLAQFYVAESYAQEGKGASADSVYRLVVARYPTSEKAATALYKHGLHLQASGRKPEARAVFADVVKRFPRSDEAVLAGARLKDAP